jgi:glycosyltransferase involved in cell wall biosynthesis
MLEAMATGCLIVASNTPPVKELITDGYNGFLVNFFSPDQIANKVIEVLDNQSSMDKVRSKARETIIKNYRLPDLLFQHLEWIKKGKITKSKKVKKARGFA